MYVSIYLFLISLFSVNICYLLSILGTFHNYKHFPSRVVVRIRELLCGFFGGFKKKIKKLNSGKQILYVIKIGNQKGSFV